MTRVAHTVWMGILLAVIAVACTLAPGERAEVPPSAPAAALGASATRAPASASAVVPAGAPRGTLELVETWPEETTLDQPDIADAAPVWKRLLSRAERRIDVAQMYLAPREGSRLDPVVAELLAAGASGKEVRLLLEEKFTRRYPGLLKELRSAPGIELRVYPGGKVVGGILHAKYFIVDGRRAFLGSQNFDWRSLQHIEELGVAFDHPQLVGALAATFEQDWAAAGGAPAPAPPSFAFPVKTRYRGETVEVWPGVSPKKFRPPGVPWDLARMLRWIDQAQGHVRVQLLNYSTHNYDGTEYRGLQEALVAAAKRGVSVELVLSHWQLGKGKVADAKALVKHGVRVTIVTIPEHSSGFEPFSRTIHSKYMVVDDDRSWIGTSNWSGDYFFESRNVGLLVRGAALAKRLTLLFEALRDSEYAEPLLADKAYPEPRVAR